MSLEPFIRVSQKNYLRMAELKKMTQAESMDKVIDALLNSKYQTLDKEQVVRYLQR